MSDNRAEDGEEQQVCGTTASFCREAELCQWQLKAVEVHLNVFFQMTQMKLAEKMCTISPRLIWCKILEGDTIKRPFVEGQNCSVQSHFLQWRWKNAIIQLRMSIQRQIMELLEAHYLLKQIKGMVPPACCALGGSKGNIWQTDLQVNKWLFCAAFGSRWYRVTRT